MALQSNAEYTITLSGRDLVVIQKYLFPGSYHEVAATIDTITRQLETLTGNNPVNEEKESKE